MRPVALLVNTSSVCHLLALELWLQEQLLTALSSAVPGAVLGTWQCSLPGLPQPLETDLL